MEIRKFNYASLLEASYNQRFHDLFDITTGCEPTPITNTSINAPIDKIRTYVNNNLIVHSRYPQRPLLTYSEDENDITPFSCIPIYEETAMAICDRKEDEEMSNTKLEDLLTNGIGGINSIKNKAISSLAKYGMLKLKNHFGCERFYYSPSCIYNSYEVLKKYDKKNVLHLTNDDKEVKNRMAILKLQKDTFVYVEEHAIGKDRADGDIYYLYLYFFGKKAFAYRNKFTSECDKIACTDNRIKTRVYNISTIDRDSWKSTVKIINNRGFDTLYFNDNIEKDIKAHLDSWMKNESIYKERGLLFKTGILLYGEPGTGKSSIAMAIADYLNCDIINIDLSNFSNFNIGEIVNTINADENKYVVLLDEIDTLFKSREDQDITQEQKEAINKLLMLLDSVQSPNNVVFVATTNYIERIDKAVIREGRFDKQYCIKNISKNTAIKMCYSFNLTHDEINNLLENKAGDINPARLQAEIVEVIKDRYSK